MAGWLHIKMYLGGWYIFQMINMTGNLILAEKPLANWGSKAAVFSEHSILRKKRF